jgi:hypothetical protein
VHQVPAVADPNAGRLRRRRSPRRPDVRRRGTRLPRGQARRAVRRSGREAAGSAAGGHRARAVTGLHRERPEVPPAGEPRPDAGRDRVLRRPPLQADRAHPAEGHRDARQLRDEAPVRQAARDHPRPRHRADRDARRDEGDALPALPSRSGALHAGDAERAPGGFPARSRAARARGDAAGRAAAVAGCHGAGARAGGRRASSLGRSSTAKGEP